MPHRRYENQLTGAKDSKRLVQKPDQTQKHGSASTILAGIGQNNNGIIQNIQQRPFCEKIRANEQEMTEICMENQTEPPSCRHYCEWLGGEE